MKKDSRGHSLPRRHRRHDHGVSLISTRRVLATCHHHCQHYHTAATTTRSTHRHEDCQMGNSKHDDRRRPEPEGRGGRTRKSSMKERASALCSNTRNEGMSHALEITRHRTFLSVFPRVISPRLGGTCTFSIVPSFSCNAGLTQANHHPIISDRPFLHRSSLSDPPYLRRTLLFGALAPMLICAICSGAIHLCPPLSSWLPDIVSSSPMSMIQSSFYQSCSVPYFRIDIHVKCTRRQHSRSSQSVYISATYSNLIMVCELGKLNIGLLILLFIAGCR